MQILKFILFKVPCSVCLLFRGRQRLRAAEFVAGNKEHLEQLKKMGIRIVTVNDGRAQLLHTASEV